MPAKSAVTSVVKRALIVPPSPAGAVLFSLTQPQDLDSVHDERWANFWRTLFYEAVWLHVTMMAFNLLCACTLPRPIPFSRLTSQPPCSEADPASFTPLPT